MSDENENGRPGGRAPITLKPRQGSVSAGVVKQSFSHGRTKTVVVETKRTRSHAPASGNLAAPSSAERRHDAPPQRPQQSQGGGNASSGGGGSAGGLSQEELRARQRAIESAREAQARQAADRPPPRLALAPLKTPPSVKPPPRPRPNAPPRRRLRFKRPPSLRPRRPRRRRRQPRP